MTFYSLTVNLCCEPECQTSVVNTNSMQDRKKALAYMYNYMNIQELN